MHLPDTHETVISSVVIVFVLCTNHYHILSTLEFTFYILCDTILSHSRFQYTISLWKLFSSKRGICAPFKSSATQYKTKKQLTFTTHFHLSLYALLRSITQTPAENIADPTRYCKNDDSRLFADDLENFLSYSCGNYVAEVALTMYSIDFELFLLLRSWFSASRVISRWPF